MEAMEDAVDDDSDLESFASELGGDDHTFEKVDYSDVAERRRERGNLEEWPDIDRDMNNKFLNWPQENAAYFKRYKQQLGSKGKMYVRTDKYPLCKLHELCMLLPEGDALPTIMSAYEK
jgi:hypothetical protein